MCFPTGWLPWRNRAIKHKTAIFRQVNTSRLAAHHDALEFPNGRIVLLTQLRPGQEATVLQLPARAKAGGDAGAPQRAAYAG
jgi:hypothetical protein